MRSRQVVGLVAAAIFACLVASYVRANAQAAPAGKPSPTSSAATQPNGPTTDGGTQDAGTTRRVCQSTRCPNCGLLEECAAATGSSCKVCVSKSVTVPVARGGTYKIDSTETTYTQYRAWLATSPSYPPPTPGNVCSSKTSGYNAGTGSDNFPVADVDWCDSYAYCASVGKRLCGRIGGGPVDYENGWRDETQSQWYNACTSGDPANHPYPYGTAYDSTTCNLFEFWHAHDAGRSASTFPVSQFTGCSSSAPGYTGIFDLNGNVFEWEDSCTRGDEDGDSCRLRGASFGLYLGDRSDDCVDGASSEPNSFGSRHDVGFRCCSR